jgi:predicted ATP-grasp superfamily ATP-dependent carboligase
MRDVKGRVIVTYGRSLMALTAAHSLGSRGIEIIGCDDVDMTVVRFSKYVSDYFLHAPYQKDVEQYLDDLEKQIIKHKPDDDRPYILMPMFRDAKILSEYKDRFRDHITVSVPDYETISRITPKDVFAETCAELGLSIPYTYHPEDESDLENYKEKIDFPLLIKTPDGAGGRGIDKVNNYEELVRLFVKNKKEYGVSPLLQQMVEGRDYCLTAICNHGQIEASMAYKNVYQFPRDTGAGIMRETIDDKPFIETADKLLGALKWHGLAQLDFRWNGKESDPPYLIEANPRYWAGLFHSVESGIDYPWLLYQLMAFGKITDKTPVKIGTKTKVQGLWAISAIQDVIDSGIDLEGLKNTWKEIWDKNSDESWRNRFSSLADSMKDSIDLESFQKAYKTMQNRGEEAGNEFVAEEDPKTALGFLFIASSLIRHGELPPEVKQ